ncbi:MAG: hypothetical protein DSZ31_00765 [Gammaproteobacteria bacterium]|nr:MAG: hypothetical protein DSZ31_00765 [Gammaproteobacteria bacterium]
MGSFLAGSLIGIISCGSPAERTCSDEKVVKTLKAGLFGKDLITALILGEKYIEKKYGFSEEELKNIYSGLKKIRSEEEAVNFINNKLGDKIRFLGLTLAEDFPYKKKTYHCRGIFRVLNKEKYSIEYKVREVKTGKYEVKIERVTILDAKVFH